MLFSKRKLDQGDASSVRQIDPSTLKPGVPLVAPVYFYLKQNQKFVAIKRPLDLFGVDELEKFKQKGPLFHSDFIDQVEPFLRLGKKIKRRLIQLDEDQSRLSEKLNSKEPFVTDDLPESSVEISDWLIQEMGSLWSSELKIEPFFFYAFVKELCDPLSTEALLSVRDEDIEIYERGLLRSSCLVFLSLHLGESRLEVLNQIRKNAFEQVTFEEPLHFELNRLVEKKLNTSLISNFDGLSLETGKERISKMLASRLERIKKQFAGSLPFTPSIFGEKGFAHGR